MKETFVIESKRLDDRKTTFTLEETRCGEFRVTADYRLHGRPLYTRVLGTWLDISEARETVRVRMNGERAYLRYLNGELG